MPSFCRSGNEWRSIKELGFRPSDAVNSRDTMNSRETKSCRDSVSCLDIMGSHGHRALTPYSDDTLDSLACAFSAGNFCVLANPPARTGSLCMLIHGRPKEEILP